MDGVTGVTRDWLVVCLGHPWNTRWWFGTWLLFSHILEKITQLTKSIFFRGVAKNHQPVKHLSNWKTTIAIEHGHRNSGFSH